MPVRQCLFTSCQVLQQCSHHNCQYAHLLITTHSSFKANWDKMSLFTWQSRIAIAPAAILWSSHFCEGQLSTKVEISNKIMNGSKRFDVFLQGAMCVV